MTTDPREVLRAWVPHLALLGLALAAGWWLLVVIAPVHESLMLAVALAVITYPVLFQPIDRLVTKTFRHWSPETLRYISALTATTVLVVAAVGITLSVLVAVVGDVGGTLRLLIGLAIHDPVRVAEIIDLLIARFGMLESMFPDLHLDLTSVRASLTALLSQVSVGPAVMQYLITGTGGFLAQSALTLVTLFYLYSQGPRLVVLLMSCLPLSFAQRMTIESRFQSTAVHLVTGTLARAACHGLILGLLAALIGGFNVVLVAIGAAFISLLPVAGPTVAWLPLASLLWSKGDIVPAISLGMSALAASWLIEHLAARLATRLGTDDLWLSFLLFLGLVGGLIGFGFRGLILGPAAVLTVSVLLQVLPALYGRSNTEDNNR